MKVQTILITCLVYGGIYAQQDPQFTNFKFQQQFYNPASITQTSYLCGEALVRNQWNSFAGNPNTGFIGLRGTLDNKNHIGIQFLGDQLGMQKSNHLKLSYAYKFKLDNVFIGMGISGNAIQSSWTSGFITPDTPQWQDDAIPNQNYSKTKLDLDAGVFVTAKNIFMGLSTTHLTQSDFSQNGVISYRARRHYHITAGWQKNYAWGHIAPKILAKSDITSTQLDFQLQTWFRQKYLAGVNYRLSDAISVILGYQINTGLGNMQIIYAYDITTSNIRKYSNGSHEIGISFCRAKPTYRERYTDPRNLGNYDFGPRGQW